MYLTFTCNLPLPLRAGAHCIQVTAGDVEVSGSPFMCEVYDVDHVYVSMPRRAVSGKLYEFQGSFRSFSAVFCLHSIDHEYVSHTLRKLTGSNIA